MIRTPSSHFDLPVASRPETSGGGAFFAVSVLGSLLLPLFSGLCSSPPDMATMAMMTRTTTPPAMPRIRGRLFFAGAAGAVARPEAGAAEPRRVGGPALAFGAGAAGRFPGGTRPVCGFFGGNAIARGEFNELG